MQKEQLSIMYQYHQNCIAICQLDCLDLNMQTAEPFRFRRKPAANLQPEINTKPNPTSPVAQKPKQLTFKNKIFEINLCLSAPYKQKADQSLAYSISLTPITSSQKKNVQQDKMQEAIRYLYGTETHNNKIEEIYQSGQNQEESILIQYEQLLLNSGESKMSFTPLTNCTNTIQGQFQKNYSLPLQILCSKFQLTPSHYRLSCVFLTDSVIKLTYSPAKESQDQEQRAKLFSALKLVARMRLFFSKSPLAMFQFIANIQIWSDQSFKMFLMANAIKFSLEQFTQFKLKLQELSLTKDNYSIVQELFLYVSEEREAVINLQNLKFDRRNGYKEKSLLSFFQVLIKHNEDQHLGPTMLQIEQFIRKTI